MVSVTDEIRVTDDTAAPVVSGNAAPLLHEIRHGLEALIVSGQETTLDLTTLPLTPDDEQRLFAVLGEGEIEIQLHALGETFIRETSIGGVWLIEHFDADQRRTGCFIEITTCPSLLRSPWEHLRQGLDRLSTTLATR